MEFVLVETVLMGDPLYTHTQKKKLSHPIIQCFLPMVALAYFFSKFSLPLTSDMLWLSRSLMELYFFRHHQGQNSDMKLNFHRDNHPLVDGFQENKQTNKKLDPRKQYFSRLLLLLLLFFLFLFFAMYYFVLVLA